jgi:Tfp pilus assembly protein PilN
MITVNLKPGVKRSKPTGFGNAIGGLKDLPRKIKDPWPIAAIAVSVNVAGFLAWIWIGSAIAMRGLEGELAAKRAENRRNRQLLAEKRRAEAARDSVVNQIATIRLVDEDRYVWAHVLDEVSRAVPAYLWLTDVQPTSPAGTDTSSAPPPVAIQLTGRTMDLAAFTRFMRQLEDSPWLKDVSVITTGTEIDHGRAVTVFTLKANYTRHRPERTQAASTGD